MKIGLITFHNALNYGAVLQAYATQKYLNDRGHECIIIDYTNESREKAYDMKAQTLHEIKRKDYKSALKMAAGSFFMKRREINFDKFTSKHIVKTKFKYNGINELNELNKEFDYFIIGSDQVWNPKHNGEDMAYLLEFVDDKTKTVSYASSFGSDEIPEHLLQSYRNNLKNIKYLSAREELGIDLIKKLTGREAELVLDPVFLLGADQWREIANESRQNNHRSIFVYTNRKNQFENMIKTAKLSLDGCKIHKINRYLSPIDFINPNVKVDYYITPQKFLKNIDSAELVATASFHCVAFSILLHKQFVAFLTGDNGKDERIINLLKITGLINRIFNEGMTKEDIFERIDYSEVDNRLSEYVERSRSFLNNIF
jgi:hypothetical protein